MQRRKVIALFITVLLVLAFKLQVLADIGQPTITWQQTMACEWNDDQDRIIITKTYPDGTTKMRMLRRYCNEPCFSDTGWFIVQESPLSNPHATTADTNGDLLLLDAAPGMGGVFSEGTPTCRAFTSNASTMIRIPYSVLDYSIQ